MIEYRKGNALDVGNNSLIVHGCNCMGVMGSGIAREIKERFPHVYEAYRKTYESMQTNVGGPFCGLIPGEIEIVQVQEDKEEYQHKFICNANTQPNFGPIGRQVSYDALVKCFEYVKEYVIFAREEAGVTLEVVFPKIGAGLGGGDWDIIAPIIDKTLGDSITKICYVFP
jgi:O-acetyl-ADP-ribose deacetylase (regulator of RNase III)